MIEVSKYENDTEELINKLGKFKTADQQHNAVAFSEGWYKSKSKTECKLYTTKDVHRILKTLYKIGQKTLLQPTKAM